MVKSKINKYEENVWIEFALSHPNLDIARACPENVPPRMFWAITDIYPDPVARRYVQVSASLAEKTTKHFVISFLTVRLSNQILTNSGVICF